MEACWDAITAELEDMVLPAAGALRYTCVGVKGDDPVECDFESSGEHACWEHALETGHLEYEDTEAQLADGAVSELYEPLEDPDIHLECGRYDEHQAQQRGWEEARKEAP